MAQQHLQRRLRETRARSLSKELDSAPIICVHGAQERIPTPPTPGCKPQQPYLSQHGLENIVSESLGEDLSSFAKREALRRMRRCHTEGWPGTQTPNTQGMDAKLISGSHSHVSISVLNSIAH